jgi:hypothetical protein
VAACDSHEDTTNPHRQPVIVTTKSPLLVLQPQRSEHADEQFGC